MILVLFCLHSVITILLLLVMFLFLCALVVNTWIFNTESFPTNMRATSCGVLNTINRIGAAAGAFTTEYVDTYSLLVTLVTYVVVMVFAAVAVLFIRTETRGTRLADQTVVQGTARGYRSLDRNEEVLS